MARLQVLGQVFAPDLPGFGEEPPLPTADRSIACYVDWTAEQIRLRWPDRRVDVAGYSMGGTIALLLALRHPHLVRRLAIVCSPPNWMEGWRQLFRHALSPATARLGAEIFQWTIRLGVRWLSKDRILRDMADDMARRADRRTMVGLCRDLATLNSWDVLRQLVVPVLVVAGTRDFWFSPSEAREMVRRLPEARLHLFEKGAHILCLSRADEFSSVLEEFFSCRP